MLAEIYALYSARDGGVRYVGWSGDSALRFKEHLRSEGCPVGRWIAREWRDGHLVQYAVLETCDYDRRHAAETEWIWRFPGSDLLNRRKQRRWFWTQVQKPPTVPAIKKYMRRHIFNVEGFRGVHYDREEGRYRVWVYNGSWPSWLTGDELPCARYCQIHRDPARRDLALQLAKALGLENLGPGLTPAATPA